MIMKLQEKISEATVYFTYDKRCKRFRIPKRTRGSRLPDLVQYNNSNYMKQDQFQDNGSIFLQVKKRIS